MDSAVTAPKIKVAFFAEMLIANHDGAVRTMYQLIGRIDHDRFEYLFICGIGPDELYGFEVYKVPSFTVPINRNYKMALPQLAKGGLTKKLQNFNPDVVHIATPSMLGNFGLAYAHKARLPVITIYHTHFISYIDYYLKQLPFLINFVKKQIAASQRKFYNGCNLIYVPAKSIAAELQQMGIQGSRMKIWQRGIDTQLFSPEKRDEAYMRKLTGNDNPVVLFASRLVWEKNLKTVFKIYHGLKSRGIAFNLVMAGDGVARVASEEAMPGAIFTGTVDHEELARLYASADIFLFPSISETYGNVVLEAMASGLPVVIANGGGSADFVDQGENGFKCDPYNENDYIEKIITLLNNPELCSRFAGHGLAHSRSLSWQQLAQTYFDDVTQLALPASKLPLK